MMIMVIGLIFVVVVKEQSWNGKKEEGKEGKREFRQKRRNDVARGKKARRKVVD